MMDRIGRKKTLLLTEIPLILGWLLISIASDVRMIYGGKNFIRFNSFNNIQFSPNKTKSHNHIRDGHQID